MRYKKITIDFCDLPKANFSFFLFATDSNFNPIQDLHVLKKLLCLHCCTVTFWGTEMEHRTWKAHAKLE